MPLIALPGLAEMLIIGGVIVLLFGAKKLPALGGAIGESIKNFKKGVNDPKGELSDGHDGVAGDDATKSETEKTS